MLATYYLFSNMLYAVQSVGMSVVIYDKFSKVIELITSLAKSEHYNTIIRASKQAIYFCIRSKF